MRVINGKVYATAREFMKIYKAAYAKDSTIQLTLKEAKQTMTLDPAAQSYTDDQIVGKINNATATITRASSVDAAARPIAAGEGIVCRQPDAGTTADTRTLVVNILWEEW